MLICMARELWQTTAIITVLTALFRRVFVPRMTQSDTPGGKQNKKR